MGRLDLEKNSDTGKIHLDRQFHRELCEQIVQFRALLFATDPHVMDEMDFHREKIASGHWYAVGIPPQQVLLEEPFAKTEDVFHLVRGMLRLGKESSKATYFVVANLPYNILAHPRDQGPSKDTPLDGENRFEQALTQADLIGRKDRPLYQAAQKMAIEEARLQGEELFEIPVLLMSDLVKSPQFVQTFGKLIDLFDSDPRFAEAVYQCVPLRLRHRKHRQESYAALHTLLGDAALKEAQKRIPYVLYQIAAVLALGGEKIGHTGEGVYNEATLLAAHLFKKNDMPQFRVLHLPKASGANPYRSARADSPQQVPDALTGIIDATVLAEIPADAIETFIRDAAELHEMSRALNLKLLQLILSPEGPTALQEAQTTLAELDRRRVALFSSFISRVAQDRDSKAHLLAERVERHSILIDTILGCVRMDHTQTQAEKSTIIQSIMDHEVRETLLQVTKEPFHLEQFLFRWTGMTAALNRQTSVSVIAEQASKWFPFSCPTPKEAGYSENYHYLLAAGQGLLCGANDGSPSFDLRAIFPSSPPAIGRWTLPFESFMRAVFNFELEDYKGKDPAILLGKYLGDMSYAYSKGRWEALNQFFETIQGTAYERLYQQWMAALVAGSPARYTASFDRAPTPDLAERVSKILASHVFAEGFRRYFSLCLEEAAVIADA